MARTRGGCRIQPRRSSRLRQLSLPKNNITEPIDLVESSCQSEDTMSHTANTNNDGDFQENESGRKFQKSNNRYKTTARKPVDSSSDDELEKEQYSIRYYLGQNREVHQQNTEEDQEVGDEQNDYDELNTEEEQNDEQNRQEDQEMDDDAVQDESSKKIKVKKWKRKKTDKDENENHNDRGKKKRPNVTFLTKKNAPQKYQVTEGAKHINKAKAEIKIRNSPRIFSEMVYYLKDEQKQWVRKSGFGALLDFCLEMLPAKMAYNIFQIFDHNCLSLKLKDKEIQITEDDVFDVLGLPRGGQTIMLGSVEMYQERIDEWLTQFPTEKERDQITTGKIVQIMKGQGLTENFKLNFLIVMSNVLVGTPTNSYIDKQLLRLHGDLDQCYNYNWAEYLLNYLVSATQSWNRTASIFFRGSLIFLMLFYVDRVRHKGINLVERCFPSYKGWTEEKLKQRQAIELFDGVFGIGSVLQPLRELQAQDSPKQTNINMDQNQYQEGHANTMNINQNDHGWDSSENVHQTDHGWDAWENDHQNDHGWDAWENDHQNDHYQSDGNCNDKEQVDNVDPEDIQQTQNEPDQHGGMDTNVQGAEKMQHDKDKPKHTEEWVEALRERAQDLIETKMLLDIDLKIALQKDPKNEQLLTIQDVINHVFCPRKEADVPMNSNQKSSEQDKDPTTTKKPLYEDDFELRHEDIQQIDLIDYLNSAQTNIQQSDLFHQDEEDIPSFSLGIDNDIHGQDVNTEPNAEIEKIASVITPEPAMREKSTRVLRMGRYGKSPFIERVIDITSKLTNQDFGLWRFMIQKRDPLEQLFSWNEFFCIREDMQTFKLNQNLSNSVVDTWATILNDNEKYKADESPMRLFCTIGCVYPTLDELKSVSLTYPLFAENMDEMLNRFNRNKLDIIDMVFFPICAYEHFYLICYNFKNEAYEIIDNIARADDAKICYGRKPRILHSHFTKYLQAKGHFNLAKKLRKMRPSYIKMAWQTKHNSVDCGVFLMRHMETYKGDIKTWDTAFNEEKHGQESQIIKLRVKYNNAILSSKLNNKREPILKEGKEMYIEVASRRLLNLVIESSQPSQEEERTMSNPTNTRGKSGKKKTVTFAKNLTTTFDEVHHAAEEL